MVRSASLAGILLFLGLVAPLAAQDAQTKRPADLLPDTTAVYVEIPQPGALLDAVVQHPVVKHLQASPDYQQLLQTPQYIQARAGLAFIEFGLQSTWPEIAKSISEGGMVLAVDAKTQGVVLMAQARDAESLTKFRNVIVNLVRDDAKKNNRETNIKTSEYRGFQAYEINQVKVATVNRWLIVTNKGELGQQIIDRYVDNTSGPLTANERFVQAAQQRPGDATAWAFVDMNRVREIDQEKKTPFSSGKADNPAAELLIGGLLSTLQHTPFATGFLKLDNEQIHVALSAPHDPSWVGETREYYFGPKGEGRAPALLQLPNSIFSLATYRDVSGMWLHAGDLFNKEVNDKFAEAEANLSTLFSGRDFGEDILGTMHPEMQLVIVRQTYPEDRPQPSIKLPAFALIAQLKEPVAMQRDLRRIYSNLIGFVNITGAMNGQPQLDMAFEEQDGANLVTTSYALDADKTEKDATQIRYNFSPSVAFVGPHFVISSASDLAQELAKQLKTGAAANQQQASAANTVAQLDSKVLREVLHDNLNHLVAQNVLEKGTSREQAQKQINGLLSLLELVSDVQLRFQADTQAQLDLTLHLQKQ